MQEFKVSLPHGVTIACRALARAAPAASVPRVLLVHGFPEAAFVWDEVIEALGATVHAVAMQLRGYPGSSAPPQLDAYRARHPVADMAALVEHLGAPVDVLVAHDWGGAVAWSLAARQPQLMRRLLIINSPHPAAFVRELRTNTAQQQASSYMNFLCRPDAEALLAENDFARMWPFFGDAAWLDEAMRDRYRRSWAAGLTGPLNYYRASPIRPVRGDDAALERVQLDDEAVTVRVPTHVLWGLQDHALLPGLLDGLERWVPALTVERVPDASHWIVHEQPQRVAATVRRLLGQPAG
ncbi:MAG: alpha/beta fold hydrolase [Rubrivivax sp.]|nr:alpha/beta fold hydrolase [Rubrivivax sp.]